MLSELESEAGVHPEVSFAHLRFEYDELTHIPNVSELLSKTSPDDFFVKCLTTGVGVFLRLFDKPDDDVTKTLTSSFPHFWCLKTKKKS